jgi:CRP-like cAMP-binding protein
VDELTYVSRLKAEHIRLPPRSHVVEAGSNGGILYTLYSGWAFRYKSLPGGRRQVLDFLLPGDLIGLQSPMTGTVRHGVCTMTDAEICALRAQPFRGVFAEQPALAAGLVATLLLDEERADTRLVLLGRQRATQRLAYLLLETHARLLERDLADEDSAEFPLTYDILSDALGLSRAQFARSRVELRQRGLASLENGQLRLLDRQTMQSFSGYEELAPSHRRAIL